MKSSKKIELPRWLARIQEQSWEPEILISGIVLLALFQLPAKIDELYLYLNKFSFSIFETGTVDETLTNVMRIALYWLIAGFSAHLFFRSIWVAYVGLSYVYPHGINKKGLRYKKRYLRNISFKVNMLDRIKKLESLCSTMFALGFLFFMIVFGFFFALLIVTGFVLLSSEVFPNFVDSIYFDSIFSFLLFIYLLDFISLGSFKRIPYISYIYYPFYKLQSYLTLSFLYRDVLYYFISNNKKWKVFLFVFLFTSISVIGDVAYRNNFELLNNIELSKLSGDKEVLFTEHYENLATGNIISKIQINSDIVKGDFLRAFIEHNSFNEKLMKDSCFVNGNKFKLSDDLKDSVKLDCLNEFYSLKIDDSLFTSDYLYTRHPITKQFGLMAYMNVSYLDQGMHTLNLLYKNNSSSRDSLPRYNTAIVEFIKE